MNFDDLVAEIRSHGIPEVTDGKQHWDNSFIIRNPALLASKHYEYSPDLLIYNATTFTMGFVVNPVQDSTITTRSDVKVSIKKGVEEAVYVFHQLYIHAQAEYNQGHGCRVPTVELVFLFENGNLDHITEALQELAKETNLMHAIGVGLLIVDPNKGIIEDDDFRRAFPWLLKNTKSWYKDHKKTKPILALNTLQLDAYRLGYPLKLEFNFPEAKYPLHLVHGHNGTGKSTLTEVFELVLSNQIDRINREGKTDYLPIIRNRYAQDQPTKITLNDKPWDLSASFSDNPFHKGGEYPHPASFRLDQRVMTQLTERSDEERANLFLSAFFPDQQKKVERMNDAKKQLNAALVRLAKAFPEKGDLDQVKAEFAWLFEEPLRPNLDGIKRLLPISWENLERLGDRLPVLTKLSTATSKTLGTLLKELDGQLVQLQETGISGKLSSATEALSKLKTWQPATGSTQASRQEALDRWLETLAYADLADRQASILQTQQRALELAWRDSESFFKSEPSPVELQNALRQKKDWLTRRDQTYSDMEQVFQQETQTPSGTTKLGQRITLSRAEIDALNQVGPWILNGYGDLNFGTLCADAVAQAQFRSAGSVVIGQSGWTEPLLNRIKELMETFEQLEQAKNRGLWESAKRLKILRSVKREGKRYDKEQAEVNTAFLGKIAQMVDPLNELMALFTPARWAYHDLKLNYNAEGENQSFRLEDGGADAALRLNTAELNLFTVALFLLCAPRIDNALKVLILDDPLQNMDEMTATSFARGLNQVMAYFPEGWNLIFLFHGEDDMERFCQLLPEAAQYRLKWLSPQPKYDDTLVTVDRKQVAREKLVIGKVLEFVPNSTAS